MLLTKLLAICHWLEFQLLFLGLIPQLKQARSPAK